MNQLGVPFHCLSKEALRRTLQRHQCACAQVSPARPGLVGWGERVRLAAGLTKPRGARGRRCSTHSASVRTHLRPHRRAHAPAGTRRHTQAQAGTCMQTREQTAEHSPLKRSARPRAVTPRCQPPRCTLQSRPELCGSLKLGGEVGGIRAETVWASPGGGSCRTLRSASPLKNPPAEEADVGAARPMAAARLERLGDLSQSERQSRFRPIDGRRARQPPTRTRCPCPRSALQPQRPPRPQPQPQRDARPWRRGTDESCAGARAPGSLAPGVAAPPRGGPRRPRPQLAPAPCPPGPPSPSRSAGPPCSCCRRAARSCPCTARRSFSSCPAAATCECRGPRAGRAGGGGSPLLGLRRRSRAGRKLGSGVSGRGTGCPTRSVGWDFGSLRPPKAPRGRTWGRLQQ